MIGDDSTVFRCGALPTKTGHVPMFSHWADRAANAAGGSMSDTSSPSTTRKTVCVETNVRGSTCWRGSPFHGDVLVMSTHSLYTPGNNPMRYTSTNPAMA